MEYNNEMLKAMPNPIGRPPKFKTAIELWDRFCAYVEHVDANPWKAASRNQRQKNVGGAEVREMSKGERLIRRPYTLIGFRLFAGISDWAMFKSSYDRKKDFFVVIRAIEDYIKDNQITGAVIGEFSGNIVARLNNLAETQIIREERIEDTWTEEQIEAEKERLAKHFANRK